ncbi:MAG TPA: glycosyltransferase [Solirubrobacterales bacterium]|nr:glycosyltransferase [Solirubrobacterales bacterium]
MNFSLTSKSPFRHLGDEDRHRALVQDRPTLGGLPRTRRGRGWWLAPAIDLFSACAALAVVAAATGDSLLLAWFLAPALFLGLNGALGVYADRPGLGGDDRIAGPVLRVVTAAMFAWAVSLPIPLGSGAQLVLWLTPVVLGSASRAAWAPLLRRDDRTERWILIGDDSTAERLRAYEPLRQRVSIVSVVDPGEDRVNPVDRVAALELIDSCQADRVVIGSQHADDESLLDLVRAFKSIGVPIGLLPRPLDLLEAPAATLSRVGGVSLVEVEAIGSKAVAPYGGPDRRDSRVTRVSVVVSAMNEEKNVGVVLRGLPEGLHEVILVDGCSRDKTVEVAREARPGIRVLTQSGIGKGDALRTGFAAVTGNLVVMLDADGSANPAEIPRFVDALEAGADFAKGSRYLEGGGSADITLVRRLGNSFLSGTANLLHGTKFTDLCYGYNAFWARCLPFISLDAPGFEVETLINLRVAGAGMKIAEVPSYEENRLSGQSNLKTFRDGFRVLGTIIGEARRRRAIEGRRRPAAGARGTAPARAS